MVSKTSGAQLAKGRAGWELESAKKQNDEILFTFILKTVSPVLGPRASCCVGQVPLMNLRRGLGRPPEIVVIKDYIPGIFFAFGTQNRCFTWMGHSDACTVIWAPILSSTRLSEIFAGAVFSQLPLMLSTSLKTVFIMTLLDIE